MDINKQFKNNLLIGTKSTTRRKLFKGAGLRFKYRSPEVEEEKALQGKNIPVEKQSLFIAKAKAKFLCKRHPGFYVVCFDTTIHVGRKTIFKSKNKKECLWVLNYLNNKKHYLYTSCVIMKDNKLILSNVDMAIIEFKNNSQSELKNYVKKHYNKIVNSVGCYNIEAEGMEVIKRMHGSYYSVLGAPLILMIDKLTKLK